MRKGLAEGEDELVRIVDGAPENDRHEFRDRLRPLFARLDNRHAARLMVRDEFVGARVQSHKRRLWPGKTSTSSGSARFSLSSERR